MEGVKKMEQTVAKKEPDYGLKLANGLMDRVKEFAIAEQSTLTEKDINFAFNIITSIDKKLVESNIRWADIDIVGSRLPQQIKRYARLGLSLDEKEIYVDIRNNSKTGKKDINIKKQYQGLEKEIMRFCQKEVVRFYRDVVCKDDEFEIETDFSTGLEKVTKHNKNLDIDRNNLDNITGAYEIAYVREDGELHQYVAYVDRNRIMRAYNASPTKEKTIWKLDTRLMVLKTATWVLYNNVMKPYMNIPADLLHDWNETQDKMEFETETPKSKATNKKVDINIDDIIDVEPQAHEADIESEQ